MFDIFATEVATKSDEGVEFQPTHQGQPLVDEAGQPVTIKVHGRWSLRARTADRNVTNLRLEKQRHGNTRRTAEDFEREQLEMVVACTGGWSFTHFKGEAFPYSEANARKLWQERGMGAIRAQVEAFVNEDANFTTG